MITKRNKMTRGLAAWLPLVMLPLLVFVAAAGMLGRDTVEAATFTVQVGQKADLSSGNNYNPAAITVTVGDTVSFERFAGSHDATSAVVPGGASSFASPSPMVASTPFLVTPTVAGTYTYYCTIHSAPDEASLANIDANIAAGNRMVGKIVANAPAPDTTAPTVSGVAASPNPTNGAASVALSATAGDNIGVTQARYRVDGGASVAMTVSGASATASIPTGALSVANHTVEVQSQDAAGNVSAWVALAGGLDVTGTPAGAVEASITITGGGLNNTTSPVALPGVTLNGTDQTSSGTPATPWNAVDARGSGAGWNVTMTSTAFSSSGGGIAVSNFKTRLTAVTTVAGNAAPSTPVGSFTALSTATPLKILSAILDTGMGSYNYSPDFQLTIPASTTPGAYTASIVVSINSGP